ncbi:MULTISPECIES: hypothetical protein [Streptomyces]|uniref:Uncharacterized protein n=1 Tax=Streptomyces glycanivorans TaxID=3033808 RepID=A0ABY9JJR3_9ACTN|nr:MULTISPECIES: hypothetical protein [unclassified Streptomyces]WSQ81297.1 hypothetical protein OG725_31220 [Streptomyces sp. NBC_01213]TXS13070.1 hypothetical protein EAO68_20470 [Streptomyces sp. wa22]WLQ67952.1 hypothetical protein P8A20_32255 [Streptomyces sp. Alt3]WSQ88627.1 hypothetical protein OG722_31630 [Streptomyces sp. NBC_01212]WSR05367.1 hypothetical protein OG265_04870 [Streptomyces sp. NBC_01208]
MESAQRVVGKNRLFSRLVTTLVFVSMALLCYSVWRENAPAHLTRAWPWKLRLLDLQSATTAAVGSLGAALARGQYARAVRPALGYHGRVVAGLAPDGRLTWACYLINAAQDVAVMDRVDYHVARHSPDAGGRPAGTLRWSNREEAMRLVAARGLVADTDFDLIHMGAGLPIPTQNLLIGWLTEAAMGEIDTVLVRVRVTDRVGDVHERTISMLKGAVRAPLRPGPPLT